MKDYAKKDYAVKELLALGWLRVLLWWYTFEARNHARLIERIKDEVARGIAENDELYFYEREALRFRTLAHETADTLRLNGWDVK